MPGIATYQRRGNCCNKKSRKRASGKSKRHNTPARLENLPVELIEQICDNILPSDPFWRRLDVRSLFSLRLTCRQLNHKTFDFFAKNAFSAVIVENNSKKLHKLQQVAQWPALASKAETLLYSDWDHFPFNTEEEYEQALHNADSPDVSRRERKRARAALRDMCQEQEDRDYIGRAGLHSITLAIALPQMPKLRRIIIMPIDTKRDGVLLRRRLIGDSMTTTRMFSVLTAGLAQAGIKIDTFRVQYHSSDTSQEGISLQALIMPHSALQCFSELRELDLWLRTDDEQYRNPRKWPRAIAIVLMNTCQLRKLRLGFQNDWEDTEQIFEHIAQRVVLPHLEHLDLDFFRCRGEDLSTFMANHTNLKSLKLDSMDITGSVSFASILALIAEKHDSLATFECRQIAQNSFRLYFDSLGDLSENDTFFHKLRFGDQEDEEVDFLDDLILVNIHRYCASARAWEGVQRKIGELKDDIRLSNLSYKPEINISMYTWVHQP